MSFPVASSSTILVYSNLQENVPDSEILLSPKFVNFFDTLKPKSKQCAVAVALSLLTITYKEESICILDVLESMQELFDDNLCTTQLKTHALINFFERIQVIEFCASVENAKNIALLILERLKYNSLHGTHIKHKDSICEHGLSIEIIADNPQAEKLHKLGQDVLGINLFGSRFVNCVQDGKGVVFVTGNTSTAISYAKSAPEWVQIFLGEAYVSRHKEKAKAKLEERLTQWIEGNSYNQTRSLHMQEAQEIRDYFEQVWEEYKERRPLVFRVYGPEMFKKTPNEYLGFGLEIRSTFTFSTENSRPPEIQDIRGALEFCVDHLFFNHPVKETVSASQVAPFILPSLD